MGAGDDQVTSLLALADEEQASVDRRCKIAKISAAMTPKDRADLVLLLENPEIAATVIARVLAKRKYEITESTVKRCRKHQCWKET